MTNKERLEGNQGNLVRVPIGDMNLAPGPFCMSFEPDLDALIHALERAGLINPPLIIRAEGGGRATPVVGYRRIMAAKSMGWPDIACRDLTSFAFSERALLLFNFYDNLATRPFNDVEKGMVLKRLSEHLPREEILTGFMPLLGLPSHASLLDVYLALEGTDTAIRRALAAGKISFQTSQALLQVDKPSRSILLDWILYLNLNVNNQRYFIEYTVDISRIQSMALSDVLGDRDLTMLRADEQINRPQKSKRVMNILRQKRYPDVTAAEKGFQEMVSSLGLGQGVRLRHPPFFESTGYRLEIQCRNGIELREKLLSLSKVETWERLDDPWAEKKR